ncbi:GINS complex, Psf3 component [Sistotremastrum niveocremeum HHB9708]|uniref:DNA replication complex GINS protein PSF3 n=1 Tax=Sistotremastrum niveocremeum HHB9708 TaxID=1314777 RepID=A0A164ZDQ0_9AGAM|nr:GINS complex, Psf3 component [Sistotremastrum niveocremeum HHB9708]
MEDSYYSIDAILAENQKLQCTFKHSVPGLGYLEGGDAKDIKESDRVQLAYWLALRPLLQTGSADFTIPASFSQRVQNALNAEPRSVRLSSLVGGGGHWYALGRMIAQLLDHKEATQLAGLLNKTFQQRLIDLMDQAQHFGGSSTTSGQGGEDFREGFDATERELFALAQDSTRATKVWHESSDKNH